IALAGILLLLDLRPILDVAKCAERAGDDLLPFLEAGDDLDVRFAGESGLHRDKFRFAAVVEENAFFFGRLRALVARLLANDERLDGNRQRLRARAGDDVRRRGESGADTRRRIL